MGLFNTDRCLDLSLGEGFQFIHIPQGSDKAYDLHSTLEQEADESQ